ncbi:integral membrane protein dgcr2 idd [Willisornis vidua]|uniref:Integral membrane protein dgcr2 idd n=1 Tax=Willisornis vidua TaxID=1566151 RepID=A0ABQ9D9X2_9PASS|nr:integral membrane protein dgcr2 idd [Willisornis vidua]
MVDTSQDTIGLLGHLGTLLAHVQLLLTSTPSPFPLGHFPATLPPACSSAGVVVTQVQDLALYLIGPQTIGLRQLIQLIQIPLQSLPTLQQIKTPTQLSVACELTKSAFSPLIQIVKDIKQDWPQY